MRILAHICCGPCSIAVLTRLQDLGHAVTGFFFNPNIQPLAEYMRRRQGAAEVAARIGAPMIFADALPEAEQSWHDPWLENAPAPAAREAAPLDANLRRHPPLGAADPAPWLRAVAGREKERCLFCVRLRLQKSAEMAVAGGFDAFTSSLLYSRHQRHDAIRDCAESAARALNIAFYYDDFRRYWQEGIRISKEWGVYRQQYCGCLFSEYERYAGDFASLLQGARRA